jgi:hypothetical protein
MADPGRGALPLPDYDELPVGAVEDRIRSLTTDEVERLVSHERAHANRAPVVEILSARLERLREGAEPPSPGA